MSKQKKKTTTNSVGQLKKKNKTYQSEEARMGKWFWQILANSSICQWIRANFAHKLHTVN